jgi:hypothetical protein
MANCLNCGTGTRPSKGSRARKYCNKACSNEYYKKTKRYYKYKKKNADWGTRSKKAAAAKQKRREEYEWYKENWLTVDQLAEKLDITRGAVFHRAKGMSETGKLVPRPEGARRKFWPPEAVESLVYRETPIPEGYITRLEAAELIGVTYNTFDTNYHRLIKPDLIHRQTHGHRVIQHLYLKSNIEQFIAKRAHAEKARLLAAERKKAERQAAAARRAIKAAERKLARSKAAKEAKLQRALQREGTRQRRLKKSRDRIPNRKTDWQLPEEREKRLFARFPAILKKHANNTHLYDSNSRAIKTNEGYARLAAAGIIHKFECKRCDTKRPYYDFYYDGTYSIGRRISCCRVCRTKISKKNYRFNKPALKERRKENYRGKFRALIGTTIKQDISRMRGTYAKELSMPYIWERIEANCGYDIDGFIEHFENKFDANMNWLNHGRGTDQYYWQIDHIVPRSKFVFADLDDPAFVSCWNLSNLQPLSAYENNIKDHPFTKGINIFTGKFLEKNSALK